MPTDVSKRVGHMRCQPTFPCVYRCLHWLVLPSISTCSLGPSDLFPHSLLLFFFPKPKALLLHSFTLTAYSCQASYFIILQSSHSSHLNHSEPHALSLARPFSSPVSTFLCFFSSNSSLVSHSSLVLLSFCVHFSLLLFISSCPSAYPHCASYHPPHIRFSFTASVCSFPPEHSPSLFTCSSSKKPMNSTLLSSSAAETHTNTHMHINIYLNKKESLKASEGLTRQAS